MAWSKTSGVAPKPRRYGTLPRRAPPKNQEHFVRLIEKLGLVRPRELEAHGVSRVQLARLVDEGEGLVFRGARGLETIRPLGFRARS